MGSAGSRRQENGLARGSNGFTCQPGNPKVVGRPASCSNEVARQWSADVAAHKAKPTNAEPGIVYMLASATQPGVSDPVRQDRLAHHDRSALDDHVAVRSEDERTVGHEQRHWRVHHAGRQRDTPTCNIMGQPVGTPMEHVALHMQDVVKAGLGRIVGYQMARAIAAGPKEITDQARIMGTDAQGNRIVLREGNNDFICQPGKPQFVAQPASCYTTNAKPRITYMLAGATQRSISDRDDKTSAPLAIGPHWMIMMPFDPKTTGLPVTYSDTGARYAGRNRSYWTSWGRP